MWAEGGTWLTRKWRAQVHKGFTRAFGSVTNANNATYNIAEIWRKMTGVAPTAVTTCARPPDPYLLLLPALPAPAAMHACHSLCTRRCQWHADKKVCRFSKC